MKGLAAGPDRRLGVDNNSVGPTPARVVPPSQPLTWGRKHTHFLKCFAFETRWLKSRSPSNSKRLRTRGSRKGVDAARRARWRDTHTSQLCALTTATRGPHTLPNTVYLVLHWTVFCTCRPGLFCCYSLSQFTTSCDHTA